MGAKICKLVLAVAWLALVWVTAKAVTAMGAGAAGEMFFGDLAHPWRAQFNTDFGLHLLLVATWFAWRDRLLVRGLLFGLLAVLFGGVFTFAFIIVEMFRTKDDVRRVLLGAHA